MKTLNNIAKKQATKKQAKKVETLTAEVIENQYTEIVSNNEPIKTKNTDLVFVSSLSAKELKRLANPQFSHLVSKVKKATILEQKSNLLATFLESKKYIQVLKSELDSRNVSFFENLNKLETAIKFTNFVLSPKNADLLNSFNEIVKRDKFGFYQEYKITQSVQKVAKIVIEKKCNYSEAINYIKALNYNAKKSIG
jgi:hypothetical protein